MTIRIDQDMQISGDSRNPQLCLRAVFPTCTGLKQTPLVKRQSRIELFRGDDIEITFSVLDEQNLPVSIVENENIKFWVAVDNDSTPVFVKERENGGVLFSGGIILMGDDFRFRLIIDAADTESLTPGTYYWEVQMVTNNLRTVTMAYGDFVIKRDLIRTENEPA